MRLMLLPLFALVACADGETDVDDDLPDDWNETLSAMTDGGTWSLSYVPSPDPIPLSEDFGVTVTIVDAQGAPATDIDAVLFNATMPAHGHGMNTTPVVVDNQDGHWTVSAMLFHMPMHWRIEAEVRASNDTESAHWDIMCCK
jgi:hypothetical protein